MSKFIRENLQFNRGDITPSEKVLLKALHRIGAPAFVRTGERHITLTAEQNDDRTWADYYGEFRGGYPYVDPVVEAAVKKHGFYLEWENPACLGIYK